MGQKVNPIGLRLGIIRGWDSNWYGGKDFGQKLVEDDKVRKYLNARFPKAGVSKIYIERTLKIVTITLYTARPGLIIGKMGSEVDKLKEELKKITNKEIQININEIKRPEVEAVLVAQNIANQIEGRIFYKRAVRSAIASAVRSGAEGIKVSVSGRIGGAEMARTEHFKEGRTPLHTLRADIDYNHSEAHTTYGRIGVKVWICRGLIYGKPDLFQSASENKFRDRDNFDRRDRGGFDRRDRDRGGRDFRGGDRDRGGRDFRGGGDRDRDRDNRGGGFNRDNRGGGGGFNRDNKGGGNSSNRDYRNRNDRSRDNRDKKK
jgi:small subunit ribosomal protein S3